MILKKFHGRGFGDGWRVIFYAVSNGLCGISSIFFYKLLINALSLKSRDSLC